MTASVFLLGVGLEYVVPERAFEISINTAAVGVIWTWATIFWCQLVLRRRVNEGRITDSGFHMPGYPITGIFGIVSLAGVTALMVLDPQNRIVLAAALVYIAVMLVAWPAVKRNKRAIPSSTPRKTSLLTRPRTMRLLAHWCAIRLRNNSLSTPFS